ncbi:RNases MRP/P 32.9 kDa subunit [Erysiphe neolycopersici]|uniref:Ribonuclease P protein subunit n=1 Tax=Erysiphe neolycopersici TaxID=212602 RepID=A0A420HPW9_9PEZI|nr:RNases MRP/P 32.9 kDa subunit [Erysiphe neolycopersici]
MAPKETPLALSLLSRAHSPDTALRIYTERVRQRPLHLVPNDNNLNPQQTRRLKRVRRRLARVKNPGRPKPLSSRQVRSLDIFTIPESTKKYSIYAPLHQLWIAYIHEILWDDKGFMPVNHMQASKLCSADFHGAELEVVRSRCVSRVGVKGIVIKDSKSIFELVTSDDEVKIIPKEGTVFRFQLPIPDTPESCSSVKTVGIIPCSNIAIAAEPQIEALKSNIQVESERRKNIVFELHGDQFRHRAADRANRKFKPHFLPNL